MENNDILRRFRYALDIPDSTMVKIFKLAGTQVDEAKFRQLLKKREGEDFVGCSDQLLERFLDALILYNRGPRENQPQVPSASNKRGQTKDEKSETWKKQPPSPLTNNMVLKKLRIALELKQEDMQQIFELGEFKVTKGELTALFRNESHKNYKPCGDQYLKKFLNGLGIRHRMS